MSSKYQVKTIKKCHPENQKVPFNVRFYDECHNYNYHFRTGDRTTRPHYHQILTENVILISLVNDDTSLKTDESLILMKTQS